MSVNGFKWVKDLPKFDACFIKNYDENSDKKYILEVDVKYPKKLFTGHKDVSYLPERKKSKNVISLFAICKIKKYVVHIRTLKQALIKS